jgi:hypothetical protein
MLFILNEKDFYKYAKKLVEHKDYIIYDATDDSSRMTEFRNRVEWDKFTPGGACLDEREKDIKRKTTLDVGTLDRLEEKHFKSDGFIRTVCTGLHALTDNDGSINCFIVVSNRAYTLYSKVLKANFLYYVERGVKRWNKKKKKKIEIDFDFIFMKKDFMKKDGKKMTFDKKILSKDLSKKKCEVLDKVKDQIIDKYINGKSVDD